MTIPTLALHGCFVDDPDGAEEAGLVSGRARVVTTDGPVLVPGRRHLDVPHLAVTSHHLGRWDVTHLPTGETLIRGFEHQGSALLALARVHAVRVRYRLDLSSPDPVVTRLALASVCDQPVPFAPGPLSHRPAVLAYLAGATVLHAAWSLAWETPADMVREALELIALTPALVVTPPVDGPHVG